MNGNVTTRRHHRRSRVDEARRHRRDADVRRIARHAAVRRQPARVDDAGVEAGVPARRQRSRPARPRDDDGGERRMERDGRTVGDAGAGDEEARVERDASRAVRDGSSARCPSRRRTTDRSRECGTRPSLDFPPEQGSARREADGRGAARGARPDVLRRREGARVSRSPRATSRMRGRAPAHHHARAATSTPRCSWTATSSKTMTLALPDGANGDVGAARVRDSRSAPRRSPSPARRRCSSSARRRSREGALRVERRRPGAGRRSSRCPATSRRARCSPRAPTPSRRRRRGSTASS